MIVERLVLVTALALLLDALGLGYKTTEYWAILLALLAYGWLSYREGYEDATDLAEATWTKSKELMEQAIARENKVLELIKEHKDKL